MGVTMILLFISRTMVNELGYLIALNGMFISLVTSGHGLVLSKKNNLGKLTSYSICIFFLGVLSFFIYLPILSASALSIYFLGSMVFAQGSISMKLSNDNNRLLTLLFISIVLKFIVLLFYHYTTPLLTIIFLGLSDIIYFRFSITDKSWFRFGLSVLTLAFGGFVNQFSGIQIRNNFLKIDFFEWIMRLIEMPSMLGWTLLLYGWSSSTNYYNKKSYYYRFIFFVLMSLLHLFLYKYTSLRLNLFLSLGIILYNLLKIELSILALQYVISGRTAFLLGMELFYCLIVLLGLKLNLQIQGMVYLLVVYALASLFVFYTFRKYDRK
jgi:hypothetical protein